VNATIDYAGALRRHAGLAAIVAAVTLLTAVLTTSLQKRVYESAAQLVAAPAARTTDTSDVIRSVETLERRTVVATFARIASTAEVREAALQRAQVSGADAERYHVRGAVVPNTNILRVEASGPDPDRVAAVANAAAVMTAQRAETLYRVYSLQVLSRAMPAAAPAYPDRRRNLLVGITLAVFLGVLSALVADRLRGAPPPREPDR
jgi:capsular polysaccharide biosynthesis protein